MVAKVEIFKDLLTGYAEVAIYDLADEGSRGIGNDTGLYKRKLYRCINIDYEITDTAVICIYPQWNIYRDLLRLNRFSYGYGKGTKILGNLSVKACSENRINNNVSVLYKFKGFLRRFKGTNVTSKGLKKRIKILF